MANTVTFRDKGGGQKNHYKVFFDGGTKPEKTKDHGATVNDSDSIYENDGEYVAQGHLNGGKDGYRYYGSRTRHVFKYPDRIELKINDRDWQPLTDFNYTQRSDWPGESSDGGGDSDGSESDSESSERGHILAIEGTNGGTSYTLSAGTLVHTEARGGSSTAHTIEGDSVEGSVGGGVDPYEYWGGRTLSLNNPSNARVHLKKQGSDSWTEITDQYRSEQPSLKDGQTYKLTNVNSGKVLDVSGANEESGTNIQQWEWADAPQQKWTAQKGPNGHWKLWANHAGKVAEIDPNEPENGGNVRLWGSHGGGNQRWDIEPVGSDAFKLTSVRSGKALDVKSASGDNGATVHQWEYVDGDNQKWKFEEVEPEKGSSEGKDRNEGGVNGSPRTTDDVEKHFKRKGWTIDEVSAERLPEVSNQARDKAFRITGGTLNSEVKVSHQNGFFVAEDSTVNLGGYFRGSGSLFRFEDNSGGSEVRRFETDAREPGVGAKWIINKDTTLRDVTVQGEQDAAPGTKWGAGIYIGGLNRGEKVRLHNVNLPDGFSRTEGVPSHHDNIGVILGGSCDGDLHMKRSEIAGAPNNGLYASGPTKQGNDGRAVIENCTFRNSDRDQVRVGSDSVVRNCDLIVDEKKPGFDNLRGAWLRFSRGVTFENNTIKTYPGSDPGAAVRLDSTAGEATIRNNDIELRGDHYAARGVQAHTPDDEARNAGADITVEDNKFYGDAKNLKDVILIQSGRGGSTVRNNEISKSLRDEAENAIDFRR